MKEITLNRVNYDPISIKELKKDEAISNYELLKGILVNTYYGVEKFYYLDIVISNYNFEIEEYNKQVKIVQIINKNYIKDFDITNTNYKIERLYVFDPSSLDNAYDTVTRFCRNYGGKIQDIDIYKLEELNKKNLITKISRLKEKLRKDF